MKAPNRKYPLTIGQSKELALGWLTLFVVGSDLFVVSPLLPLIAADYGLPPALVGWGVTGFSLAYVVSAPILGHIADRVGRRRVLIYCLCAFGVANMLTAAAGDMIWLLAARMFAGAAAAGVSPAVYALVGSSAAAERRATCLAIVVSGLLMSLTFGAPVGALIGASLGWPIVFAGLGALSFLLVWAHDHVWREHDAVTSSVAASSPMTMIVVVSRLAPTVVWSTALYAMYTYLGEGLTLIGYSTEEIATVILVYGAGAIIGVLIGGRLTDRLGSGLTTAIGLGGLGCCLLLLRLAVDLGMFVYCAFGLSSAVAQLFFPAQQVRLAQGFPAARATILAWNNSALFLGISFGSLIGGPAISLGGFDMNLMISAAIAIVGFAINQGGRPTRTVADVMRPPRPCGT
jgi:DHA1 family purine base/nucleoside efflux pump-like MFS transporter